ncbi:MAG: chemotaxis response regulator protein-glutamate methylesterase, partial [Caenispirillum bisanense]|nr:chemotaxis response regulator protein-glutamate methylesterase [Caenispirillum bisanense]
APAAGGAATPSRVPSLHQAGAQIQLRPAANDRPDVIAIGSSTGGPQALFTVLGGIKKAGGITQPILITQHMPATFTTILAEHIGRLAGLPAKEAENGEVIQNGRVYIAPGDWHMLVETKGTDKVLRLTQDPPENFCRPAVDPMFRSIAKAYGRRVLAVVLTGMGSDGARGGKVIADAGGTVIAQDEATSVVWGMPGATAQAGVCSAVLPLPDVAPYIHKFANRRV